MTEISVEFNARTEQVSGSKFPTTVIAIIRLVVLRRRHVGQNDPVSSEDLGICLCDGHSRAFFESKSAANRLRHFGWSVLRASAHAVVCAPCDAESVRSILAGDSTDVADLQTRLE